MTNSSETKFTPGPWFATHSDPAEGYDVYWITSPQALGPHNGEVEICSVPGNKAANAALIASAPDLYEALLECEEAIEEMVECGFATPEEEGREILKSVRAALAKARGEPTP